jgi:hypothetical protein
MTRKSSAVIPAQKSRRMSRTRSLPGNEAPA